MKKKINLNHVLFLLVLAFNAIAQSQQTVDVNALSKKANELIIKSSSSSLLTLKQELIEKTWSNEEDYKNYKAAVGIWQQ